MQTDRESWLIGLQHLISSRLKCAPFSEVKYRDPLRTTPLPLANTQYIIDGIVWSLNDDPDYFPQTWIIIQNHLKESVGQYREWDAHCTRVEQETSPHTEGELLYNVSAGLQNVYHAWCLVDSVVKNEYFAERVKHLDQIFSVFPSLVDDHFPGFWMVQSNLSEMASEEYRPLFLNLLRSWWFVLPSEVNRRISDRLAFRAKQTYTALSSDGDAPSSSFMQSVDRLLGTGSTTTPGARSGGGGVSRNQSVTDHQIKDFLNSVYAGSPLRCAHCGAYFPTVEQKNVHYRSHFHNRNTQGNEKLVRLLLPSQEDFIHHVEKSPGDFVKIVENIDVAYRQGKRGEVQTNRADEATEE